MIEIISLNDLLDKEVKCCFKCGSKNYSDIYLKDHLFRLCKSCENHPDVIHHFIELNRGHPQ